MLQSIAAWLLQTYVGEYIENLNAHQLTIGYGGIELENLILRPSALRKLGLPIKLISGSIGLLNLVIPYGNPRTEPWIIKIADLLLTVEADNSVQYDYNLEEELKKCRKLDKLEAEWKINKQNARSGSWWSRSWFPSIYSSISTNIADNLQLDITNVRVQYICPQLSFTIAIKSLSAHTTNEQWEKTTQSAVNEMKYKLIELEGLSLYSHYANISMKTNENAKFILGPVYAEARIKRNASKVSLALKDGPRFHIELMIEDVLLSLTEMQYQVFVEVAEDFNRYFRSLGHSKSRPNESVKENPTAWWHFAINSIIEPIKHCNLCRTKSFLIKRVKDINLYAVLYAKHLCDKVLDSKEKASLQAIESRMKYEEIAILRRALYTKHDQQACVNQVVAPPAATASWSGWIMSFNPLASQESEQFPVDTEGLSITKEEEKFLDELDEMSVEGGHSLFNRDSVFAQIAFTLTKGCTILHMEQNNEEVLNISFNGLKVLSEVRSKSKSWEWTMTLQSFIIKNSNAGNDLFPHLMAPQSVVSEMSCDGGENFLSIKFVQKQVHERCLYSVTINVQPSNVVYNFATVRDMKEFFALHEDSKYSLQLAGMESMTNRFREAVSTQIRELKLATKAEIENIIAESGSRFTNENNEWTFDLDVNAPRIILPVQAYHEEVISQDLLNKMVIVDLGRLTFYNDHAKRSKSIVVQKEDFEEEEEDSDEFVTPSSTPPQEENSQIIDYIEFDRSQIMEKFYNNYTLELNNIEVLVSSVTKDWLLSQPKGFGPDHILDECSIIFSLKRRMSFSTDPDLPVLILSTVLPHLYVQIEQTKINVLFQSVNMFKATFSDSSMHKEDSNSSILAAGGDPENKVASGNNIFEVNFEDLLSESKLLLAKFNIQKMSFALHSRGRCFAELQIEGIESEYIKRPHDVSMSFILSSLLLLDKMQTFGAEYEHLISSKCIEEEQSHSSDVLIHICYQMIDANCPALGNTETTPVQIVSANFNLLHINGNLKTLVELHNVVDRILNQNKSSNSQVCISKEAQNDEIAKKPKEGMVEIAAHFKEIDLLLFYTIVEEGREIPQQVAKIIAEDLQLNTTMGQVKSSSGGIGSIIILDLSPESLPHKQIFSVGYQGYNTSHAHTGMEESKAFTFMHVSNNSDSHGNMEDTLDIQMASAYYTHNPYFLKQVGLCVGDFKQHAYNLAKSLQNVASDMAKSIVSAKREIDGHTQYDHQLEDDVRRNLEVKSNLTFSVSVETPIIYFPQDLTSSELLVCNLGKIRVNNQFFIETDLHRENQETDRVIIEIQKMNLSVVKLCSANIRQLINRKIHVHASIGREEINHIMIIHNTDVFLQIDRIYSYKKSVQSTSHIFELDGRIDTGLKLFLSVPTYQQILATLKFAGDISSETSEPSETIAVDSSDADVLQSNSSDGVIPSVTAKFQMPSLQLELHGELRGKQHGFVNIECEKFHLNYMNMASNMNVLDITLKDFFIEDLLHTSEDSYSYLLRSVQRKDDLDNVYKQTKSLPGIQSEDTQLISIKAITYGKASNHEEQQARKAFTIDVNSVDLVINLQTWVILFEFFGIGAQSNEQSPVKKPEVLCTDVDGEVTGEAEMIQCQMNIKSIMFYLNKEEYPLAKAGVDQLNFNALVSSDTQDVSGSIGTVELHDLSPHNGCFIKRLLTMGESAFKFSFYRFSKPDPDLRREFDMSLTLYMSSIQYIHTQRFLIECISFCQHFVFLQEVLGRMRAASAGDKVFALVNRSPRVTLKINTDAPILILPRKSTSRDVLVANLGRLEVDNKFVYASDPSTEAFNFSASRSRHTGSTEVSPHSNSISDRLLDCIKVKLSDMQVYTAVKLDSGVDCFRKQGSKMMFEPCSLELKVERNIEWAFGRQVPDMSITGQFSSLYVHIDLAQYGQIMDMLGENLGEPLDTFSAPSSVLVDPLIMVSPTQQLWTTLRIKLHLSNVSIEASDTFSYGEITENSKGCGKLAKFDLIQSDLLFESFSDGSKLVDLMSSDVLICDIRSNLKTEILLPFDQSGRKKDYLQFEIHYLDTKDKNHLTFLCNQSRILLQFDFLNDILRFILRIEENQYKKNKKTVSPVISDMRSPKIQLKSSPQDMSSGLKKSFELKINVTESELVVVEDVGALDTRTVILKTTVMFAYRPDHFTDVPVTCSLQGLEIFSCHLNRPDDSALSIVDPVAFFFELKSEKNVGNNGKSVSAMQTKPVLDVQFQEHVYLRLSYHDVQMFMQIANSAKEQIAKAFEGTKNDVAENSTNSSNNLVMNKNNAAAGASSNPASTDNGRAISGFEVNVNFASVTLIDDCGNNEVPLLDASLKNLLIQHSFNDEWKGGSDCKLDVDYYNTRVSAWEPLIEGWRFNVNWVKMKAVNESVKTAVKIGAPSRLDINLTNAFIDITNKTANLWKSRFYVDASSKEKKRAPFLPFLLRNKTGCKLTFQTVTKSIQFNSKTLTDSASKARKKEPQKVFEVDSNGEVAFTFESRTKQRHLASRKLVVHQIIVQVPGKFNIQPITVDRVSQFFRIAYNSNSNEGSSADATNDVYLLIDINLEGARKVITVKTALCICNNLTIPIEIVGMKNDKHYNLGVVDAKDTFIIPLPLIQCNLFCRPIRGNTTYQLSDELCWRKVVSRGERGFVRTCYGETSHDNVFRFCAIVQCIGFPKYDDFELHELYQPEHIITITHHVLICNQLPFDLFYSIKGRAMKELVKPGDTTPLQLKDDTAGIEVGFSFENFPHYDWIRISYDEYKSNLLPVTVYDTQKRLLMLHALIACRSGSIQISVYAPYWLINKTGIPVVFRREEETFEIAGQFDEHEEARSLTPLPFSFLSSEDDCYCQVRVGKRYMSNGNITPLWSKTFSLEMENNHRTLYVREKSNTTEKGYNIGIVMKWGRGVYARTKIISLVPRFQIDNQTTQSLYATQKCMVDDSNSGLHKGTLCPHNAVTIFHWPRCDIDNLLCVRFDDNASLWSGCIKIDCETTFHLNIKSRGKTSGTFLRVHISFHAGTFRATFTDANTFPPPFKIVNRSDVDLSYWQDKINMNEQLGTHIKAKEVHDYVLDEPLVPAQLMVSVYQDSVRAYNFRQNGKHQSKLYYQNPIFIAFGHTFHGKCSCRHSDELNTDEQFVIDAVNEKCLVLNRKANHKGSQLWRMNASGNIVHFNSTTVKEARSLNSNSVLVLDVDDRKDGYIYPLVLNQLNQRRKKTQTWYFKSNTLCCDFSADYVVHMYTKNEKSIPVLGLKSGLTENNAHMRSCVRSEKLRPGSGILSAYIYSQGPTQVLEISDSQQENALDTWMLVDHSSTNQNLLTCISEKERPSTEVAVSLASGFGISVINFHPEEVIFVGLSQINLTVNYNDFQYFCDLEVGKIQVDNQLFGCQAPVSIYASPVKKNPVKRSMDLRLDIKLERDTEYDLYVFKKFAVNMCRMSMVLEDRLFLKIMQAVQNLMDQASDGTHIEESSSVFDSHKINECREDSKRKLFFEEIVINQGDLTISLIVTGKIDEDLVPLKNSLGVPLVSFENAIFGFEKYRKNNMYDTVEYIFTDIMHYYKTSFNSQARVLLGSLDLLGNPMGLWKDVSSGIVGLSKGHVGGLFKNVAHGFSDSAAKMTGVIADKLASVDNKFLESRHSMRVSRDSSSSTHFSAGLRGLGMGVIEGITDMLIQPIEGASKEGKYGFIEGIFKGVTGAVAKPVAGVLDLASGTAAAVRNTTESVSTAPQPARLKRNCNGPGGVLGRYSKTASEGQNVLLKYNDGDTSEKYIGKEAVQTDRLKAIFTNKGVYFVKSGLPCPENIRLHVEYSCLLLTTYFYEERRHKIEIRWRQDFGNRKPSADVRMTYQCDNESVAYKVCEKINYLKSLHEESLFIIGDTSEC